MVESYASGKGLDGNDDAIRLYHIWSITKLLPVAGGIYDQDPVFMNKFLKIHGAVKKAEAKEREKQDAEMKRKSKR